ncbi:MAG: DNA-directed DNA polymerase II small subunit [Methanomethylophilus sp.]|jgi:DNA polymerase II small subunit
MKEDILDAASRRKLFLSPDALEIIDSNGYPMEMVNTMLSAMAKNTMFVSKQDVLDFLNGDKALSQSEKTIKPHVKRDTDIEVIPGSDITGNSTCEGTIQDFTAYFRSRYNLLKKIIMQRRDFYGANTIERAKSLDRQTNIIGMIYEVRQTRNGHTMLTVEDETGTISVFINKDSPAAQNIYINDEVVGITGKRAERSDLFIADNVVRPEIPKNHAWEPSDSTSSVAFLSDIHIGSKEFLKNGWEKMISWLKANAYDMGLSYIVMPGDVVDGIGAYPGQEADLEIADIYRQYDTLAEYVKEIPDDIKIVMHPGNHDACRLAEPQPALSEEYVHGFDSNVILTGNPIRLKIEGRKVTSYHGKSIDDFISAVRGMSYDDPLAVMREMAMRRHLAPMYGMRNALAPEKKDYLVMEEIPDIFVTGHVHGAGSMDYRGVKMINASTWQAQTDYQAMHNFNPDPCIMPVVNLGSGRISMKNFMK